MKNTVTLLFLSVCVSLSHSIKIAFVGDTGMEDERYYGYGHLTMKMIEDQGVDLVVDVGDFDYWGRCSESYNVTRGFQIASTWGRLVQVPADAILKRFKWQDGEHNTVKGWEVGILSAQEEDAVRFHNNEDSHFVAPAADRLVISEKMWRNINRFLNQTDECPGWGRPWDGPFEWNQFVRNHDFDFLGASGNAEVMLIDEGT